MVRKIKLCILTLALAFSGAAHSEFMSIQEVRELYNRGEQGKIMGTSYSQGIFDGLIGMEQARRHEEARGRREFCGIFDSYDQGNPIRHPAYETEKLIEEWESHGRDMEAPFVDLALSYLSGRYGC